MTPVQIQKNRLSCKKNIIWEYNIILLQFCKKYTSFDIENFRKKKMLYYPINKSSTFLGKSIYILYATIVHVSLEFFLSILNHAS